MNATTVTQDNRKNFDLLEDTIIQTMGDGNLKTTKITVFNVDLVLGSDSEHGRSLFYFLLRKVVIGPSPKTTEKTRMDAIVENIADDLGFFGYTYQKCGIYLR